MGDDQLHSLILAADFSVDDVDAMWSAPHDASIAFGRNGRSSRRRL